MNQETKEQIGAQLRAIRKSRGQSLTFIASLIDGKVTSNHLGQIEKGKGSHGIGAMQKYADALGVTFKITYQIIEKPPKKLSPKN